MKFWSVSLLVATSAAFAEVRHSARHLVDYQRGAYNERRGNPVVSQPQVSHAPTISFSNPKAKQFFVDGTTIPEVNFDVGPSWAGLMPISGHANETRKLFFWFWPTTDTKHTEDLVFWTNGGPGCSSLEGLLQENGPFTWPAGTARPTRNQWSWTKLTHMLWVEQPVGTGFSSPHVPSNIADEDQLAAQFAGFLAQFLEVFSELKGKNFYATGESYAGFYVPYIANYLYEHPNAVDLKLKGTWLASPIVTWDIVQGDLPSIAFAEKWKDALGLNSTFMEHVRKVGVDCGYTGWTDKYLKYPPAGPLPIPSQAFTGLPNWSNITAGCRIWSEIRDAALSSNPNFNVYRILDGWPVPWDVLGFPSTFGNKQSVLYFNRTDVQNAIHAPRVSWDECASVDVFVKRVDHSMPPMLSVMPNVIEKSLRTVVVHGGLDYRVITEGTRIAIQNMTWGGKQGFQTPIQNESFIIEGFGVLGRMHEERKLAYIEVDLAGHILPQFAPWAGFKTLSYLLGRQKLTDHGDDKALYPSSYSLYGPFDSSQQSPAGAKREEL